VLPNGEVVQIGKGGTGYLLSGGDLGGLGGDLFSHEVCGSSFGGTSHTSDSIHVPCTDGLVAQTVAADGRSFPDRWRSGKFNAGPPIVAGGLVRTVDLFVGALVGLDQDTGGRSGGNRCRRSPALLARLRRAGACSCRHVGPSRRCAHESEIRLRIWRPAARSGRAGGLGEEAERLAEFRP